MGSDASSLPFGQSFRLSVQSRSSVGSSLFRAVSNHPVVCVEESVLGLVVLPRQQLELESPISQIAD
jgi:hypothetical protein